MIRSASIRTALLPLPLGVVVADVGVADPAAAGAGDHVLNAAVAPVDPPDRGRGADPLLAEVFVEEVLAVEVGGIDALALAADLGVGGLAGDLPRVGGVVAVAQFVVGAVDEAGGAVAHLVGQAFRPAVVGREGGDVGVADADRLGRVLDLPGDVPARRCLCRRGAAPRR